MVLKRDHVETWVAAQTPGEPLVSHLATATWTGVVVTPMGAGDLSGVHAGDLDLDGATAFDRFLATQDLDPGRRVGVGRTTTFLAVTPATILYGGRTATNRPDDLLQRAPLDGLRVDWLDHDETGGNRFRHLLVRFGDGSWAAERTGLRALWRRLRSSTADEFFTAIGTRGVPIPSP